MIDPIFPCSNVSKNVTTSPKARWLNMPVTGHRWEVGQDKHDALVITSFYDIHAIDPYKSQRL